MNFNFLVYNNMGAEIEAMGAYSELLTPLKSTLLKWTAGLIDATWLFYFGVEKKEFPGAGKAFRV